MTVRTFSAKMQAVDTAEEPPQQANGMDIRTAQRCRRDRRLVRLGGPMILSRNRQGFEAFEHLDLIVAHRLIALKLNQ